MPERQIAWRWVASRVKGTLHVNTQLRSTDFRIVGTYAGMQLWLSGESYPYSIYGGSTLLRIQASRSLHAKISMYRNTGQVPLYQRFVRRDVIIGDSEFDRDWIINAAREAQAQAFLSADVRAGLTAIPPAQRSASYQQPFYVSHYDFHVSGRVVSADARDFETDGERMMAAIDAAVLLAQSPERLLGDYRRLARALGGDVTRTATWSMDGRIVLRFAAHGRALTVSPTTVRTGWRQDRLRTRVACDTGGHGGGPSREIDRGTDLTALVSDVRLAQQAMDASGFVSAGLTPLSVFVDLDGHVTDLERLRAAAYLATSLSQGKQGAQGPYR